MNSDEETQSDRFYVYLTISLLLFVTFCWFAISQAVFAYSDYDTESAAQRGDLFGAVNALFSAWAFVGVIVAILMQRTELQYQREELRETREQLKRSADAQEEAEFALNQQVNCQFFTAYLNALAELRSVPDASRQTLRERSTTSKLLQIVHALEQQAEASLGIRVEPVALAEHVSDCLVGFELRLNSLRASLQGASNSTPDRLVDRTLEISDDFDRVLSGDIIDDLGERFQKVFSTECLWIFDLRNARKERYDTQTLLELVDLASSSIAEMRSALN